MRAWKVAPNRPHAKNTEHRNLASAMSHAMHLLGDSGGDDEIILTTPDGDDLYAVRRLNR